jgi:hypothetical protein
MGERDDASHDNASQHKRRHASLYASPHPLPRCLNFAKVQLARKTQDAAIDSLGHFYRIVKPGRVQSITTAMIDTFVAKRRPESGKKPGSVVSPATINKDLRHIKAALRVAHEWGYLPEVPKIRMVKEPQKLATYVTPEHFDLIYAKACDLATFPQSTGQHCTPADLVEGVGRHRVHDRPSSG